MSKITTVRTGATKHVCCTHCGGAIEVAKRAMSVFCPHCKQRLILEDYKIKTYHATRLFATCGDIIVEKSGVVSAAIQVMNLTIRGQVRGDVNARGCVRVARTGRLRGDIRAPRLVVSAGAELDGFLQITPEESPERSTTDVGDDVG